MDGLKNRFPKSCRLLRQRDFKKVALEGTSSGGVYLVLQKRQISLPHLQSNLQSSALPAPQLGLTVSRRYGKAHERNRFKRQMREIFRLNRSQIPLGLQINVRPRQYAKKATYQQLACEFLLLIHAS